MGVKQWQKLANGRHRVASPKNRKNLQNKSQVICIEHITTKMARENDAIPVFILHKELISKYL